MNGYVLVASLGGIGLVAPVPGFIAVVLGVGWFFLLTEYWRKGRWFVVGGQLLGAVVVAHVVERLLGSVDPRLIVIDEFVAAPLLCIGYQLQKTRRSAGVLAVATVLFGLVDRYKPLGITAVERLPGGIGVVADDCVAALVVGGVIWIGRRLLLIMRNN